MSTIIGICVSRAGWIPVLGVLLAFASGLGGCSSAPKHFATADDAVNALVTALRADNQDELKRVLGSEAHDLLSSGDEVADANGRKEFLGLYDEKHHLDAKDADEMTLSVGATDWPLPIPVVKDDEGWYFDTEAGLDEMLSRRIGRNELATSRSAWRSAMRSANTRPLISRGTAGVSTRTKFRSDPGKKNGLFWPAGPGEPESPLGDLVAAANAEGYLPDPNRADGPRAYHGYYFRILTSQGPAAPGGCRGFHREGPHDRRLWCGGLAGGLRKLGPQDVYHEPPRRGLSEGSWRRHRPHRPGHDVVQPGRGVGALRHRTAMTDQS
jgi:hypothetical protein